MATTHDSDSPGSCLIAMHDMTNKCVRLGWRVYSLMQLALRPHAFFHQLYDLDWYQAMLHEWRTWLNLSPASHLLELGCSSGGFSASLAQCGFTVTATDRSARAIRYAQRHHRSAQLSFVIGDALQLPWLARTFHATLASSLLNVVDEPQQLVSEMARVTTADGIVSCLFPTPTMQVDTAEQYIQSHDLSGFSATALALWASAANKLPATDVIAWFEAAGMTDIHATSFLDGMVGGVQARPDRHWLKQAQPKQCAADRQGEDPGNGGIKR